jgi:hypothetical protein
MRRFSGNSTTPFDAQLLQLMNKGKECLFDNLISAKASSRLPECSCRRLRAQ